MIIAPTRLLAAVACAAGLASACSGTSTGPFDEGDAACVDCDAASGDTTAPDTAGDGTSDPSPDASDTGPTDDVATPDSGEDAGGTDTVGEDTGAPDAGPTDTGATDTGTGPTGDLPCAVQTILERHCTSCHASEPLFGSPMALVTLADLHAPAVTDSFRTAAELSVIRANSDRNPMPPAPAPRLSAAEFSTLAAWVEAGAPAGEACGTTTPDAGSDADAGSDTGTDAAPDATPDATVDAGPVEPECEWTVDFLANNGGGEGDTTPFTVPMSSNHYECFYFRPTWGTDAHGLSFTPVIDDERVVHHWLLYAEQGSGTPGTRRGCSGSHEDATLIAGWAPGGDPWIMPEDVGMQLPVDTTYFVEIHYANPRRLDIQDRSGVRVCGTNTLREHTAGTHWLGTENILLLGAGNHESTGTCTPSISEPATILKSWPHMHRYGTRMRGEIVRAGGARETMIDTPFAFDNQISHDTPFTINPGDRINTTCYWTTDQLYVTFGANTEQEMCYNFVVAYPVGAFNTGGGVRGGTDNFCLR